ncbi:MAG: hypothetical protein M1831_005013 [Alyxoria varia]|nr:MAG: hypothetical protein M1831_005013 [Alyxoria varia]
MEGTTEVQTLRRPEDNLTPTAASFHQPMSPQGSTEHFPDLSSQKTPTRDSFSGPEKRPLEPDTGSPLGRDAHGTVDAERAEGTQHRPSTSGSQDVKMTDVIEDGEHDASDNESNASDTTRPAKKKKGQRFFCTEFPPCNLSFTRSEHLARHIRLDNLRQHAQTVHVNEDIPRDSLASTSTRFQRQVRTDRVKPAGSRSRASTLGSSGHQSRGHSRNLSGSSMISLGDLGTADDPRRRHPPIAMAQMTPQKPGLSVDTYSANASNAEGHYPPNYNYSPSGYSTPMSVFSGEASSPRAPSGLQSPITFVPRPTLGWGGQNHGRRLSVPSSGAAPFQSPTSYHHPGGAFASPGQSSSNSAFSPTSSAIFHSPPKPSTGETQYETMSPAEAELRRRTWHANTRTLNEARPATSGLSYYQTPDAPQPVSTSQPAAQQAVRLPGIDSFDRAVAHPNAGSRRPHEMDVDEVPQAGETEASSNRTSWNSMNQNLGRLEIEQNTAAIEGSSPWRHSSGGGSQSFSRPYTAPHSGFEVKRQPPPPPLSGVGERGSSQAPGDQPVTPRKKKRQGLYMGGPQHESASQILTNPAVRPSPDEGSTSSEGLPTPSSNSLAEVQPAIVHSNGYIEQQPAQSMLDEPTKVGW